MPAEAWKYCKWGYFHHFCDLKLGKTKYILSMPLLKQTTICHWQIQMTVATRLVHDIQFHSLHIGKSNAKPYITKPKPNSNPNTNPNHNIRTITRRPTSADRTARRQFQATDQPVSQTQASDAMTSWLPCWGEVCATQVLPMGVGPFAFRYQGNGATPDNILIPLERQLIALQFCRWQFLYQKAPQGGCGHRRQHARLR